jgi:phospholipid/cholesterol/gamma-HCH transport system substrate-binding protein
LVLSRDFHFRGRTRAHKTLDDKGSVSRSAETLAELTQAVKEGPGLAHALIYDPESGRILEMASETLQEMSSLIQAVRDGDGAIPALLFDPKTASLAYDLTEASRKLKEISAGIARGDGTLGGLLVDPTVYEDLTALPPQLDPSMGDQEYSGIGPGAAKG